MERPRLLFRRGSSVPSLRPISFSFNHLIDVLLSDNPFIKGHPKITGVIDPIDWLRKELYCSRFRDTTTDLGEEHGGALRDTNTDLPFTQPPF